MMKRVAICFVVMCLTVMVTGCGTKADTAGSGNAGDASAEGDAHDHAGETSHGDILIEIGAYHAELVSDHDAHTVTIHFEPCEPDGQQEVVATAVTLSVFKDGEFVDFVFNAGSEPDVFSLADDALCDMLEHSQDIKSRLKATIGGEELVAKYEHEAHGDEDAHDKE